jgi:nitric-oxide synthase
MSPGCPFHGTDGSAPSGPTAAAREGEVASESDLDRELAFLAEGTDRGAGRGDLSERLAVCRAALAAGQPAPLTAEELTRAGRVAWRNHARCIGRLYWPSLRVRDARALTRAGEMFESLEEHLALATGDGSIRSVMTVFAPAVPGRSGPRIWNHQLCGYAGYRDASGRVLGDPANVGITERALELGWRPEERTAFDLLPWILSGVDERPRLFQWRRGLVREVRLRHPQLPWFAQLGLRWYAVPVISDMRFHAAGTDFPAAPFNGWYLGTEIGARNLADRSRYDLLPLIADRLGLDRTSSRSLWRDRALVELNAAVLHSFAEDGVKLVDHHTASEEFMRFCARERSAGRPVSARWDWIVPPLSPATTEVFHTPMTEFASTPDFHPAATPD